MLSRSANGVLTVRFHTDGAKHTFTGTTHHDFPHLVEDIAYDRENNVLTDMARLNDPSLERLTAPCIVGKADKDSTGDNATPLVERLDDYSCHCDARRSRIASEEEHVFAVCLDD